MRSTQCKHFDNGRTSAGKKAGHQGKIGFKDLGLPLDLSEHESGKDNNVGGDRSHCLLSSSHRQVAGLVNCKKCLEIKNGLSC